MLNCEWHFNYVPLIFPNMFLLLLERTNYRDRPQVNLFGSNAISLFLSAVLPTQFSETLNSAHAASTMRGESSYRVRYTRHSHVSYRVHPVTEETGPIGTFTIFRRTISTSFDVRFPAIEGRFTVFTNSTFYEIRMCVCAPLGRRPLRRRSIVPHTKRPCNTWHRTLQP